MNKRDKGHWAELFGKAWLVEQGYWVFDNVAPQGVIDCVAIHNKTHECIYIDFKCAYYNPKGWVTSRITNALGNKLGVKIVYVCPETKKVWFKRDLKQYRKQMSKGEHFNN